MEPNEVNIPRWYLPSFNKQSVIKKIRDIIGSTPISVSFDDIENKPTTLAGYGITDAVNINSVGTATWKDYVDVIDRYGTNLPTESAVYSLVNTMITAAQPYQGVSSTEITNGGNQLPTIGGQIYTPKLGDIVAYNNKEFVWESTNTWRELGDEGSYALKTISVWAGTGLTGGGNLTEDRTIGLSSATQDDIAKGVTAYGWGDHSQAGYAQSTDLDSYLPLTAGSGKPLTGDLYFNAASAAKALSWTYSNKTARALNMGAQGILQVGADQITNGANTYLAGSTIYIQWNTTAITRQAVFTSATFRPLTDRGLDLGSSSAKWDNFYATTLYGNLALSYLTGADDLKAIEALTGTSGFLKKTAANTWALDTAPDASTLNGKTAADILSGVESLKTTSENDAMFTYRKTPSVAVGDMAKMLKIKGKTIVWNQKVNMKAAGDYSTANVTITIAVDGKLTISGTANANVNIIISDTSFLGISGHKYYLHGPSVANNGCYIQYAAIGRHASSGDEIYTSTSGTDGYCNLRITSGAITNWSGYIQAIDLTQADLDSITSVAEFKALYSLNNYNYDTGSLQSNRVASIESVGWNQWDGITVVGYIDDETGNVGGTSLSNTFNTGFIKVFPSTSYYIRTDATTGLWGAWYDSSQNYISGILGAGAKTSPANAAYIRYTVRYNNNNGNPDTFCINLSNASRNGEYQPYHKDTLQLNVTGLECTSPNIWDEEWEVGTIDVSTGANSSSNVSLRSTNYTEVVAGQAYYLKAPLNLVLYYYDANKGYISRTTTNIVNTAVTIPSGTKFIRFVVPNYISNYTTYKNDITINLSNQGHNGHYYPYGTFKPYADGAKSAGTACDVIRQTDTDRVIGVVDLGTLSYTKYDTADGTLFRFTVTGAVYQPSVNLPANLRCANYITTSQSTRGEKTISSGVSSFDIIDSTYSDAVTFKAAMSGVPLYYEQATPEHFDLLNPLPQLIASDPDGTQRRLPVDTASSVSAPMVCDFQYGVNPSDIYEEDERKIQETNQSIADTNNAIADILTQLPSSGKVEIPTDDPVNPDNTKTYIYYDDLTHKICVREKDGTVYSVQLTT